MISSELRRKLLLRPVALVVGIGTLVWLAFTLGSQQKLPWPFRLPVEVAIIFWWASVRDAVRKPELPALVASAARWVEHVGFAITIVGLALLYKSMVDNWGTHDLTSMPLLANNLVVAGMSLMTVVANAVRVGFSEPTPPRDELRKLEEPSPNQPAPN